MNQSVEPVKWPIAPDGYIPNSVIRSWKKEEKVSQQQRRKGFFFHKHLDELPASDQDYQNKRVLWFADGDEEEGEMFYWVKPKKRLNYPETETEEDETNAKTKDEQSKQDRKRTDVFRTGTKQEAETGENELGGFVFQQLIDKQTEAILSKNMSTSDENSTVVQKREALKETGKFLSVSVERERHTPQEELKNRAQLCEDISSPVQSPSKKQKEHSIMPKDWLKPLVESHVVSADTVIPKEDWLKPLVGSHVVSADTVIPKQDAHTENPPTWLHTETPFLLKPPPPSPEDLQHQVEFGSPEFSADQDQNFLSLSSKLIKDQSQVALNLKVLAIHKKFKSFNKDFSPKGISPTIPEYHLTHLSARTSSLKLNFGGKSADKNIFHKGISPTIPEYHPKISARTDPLNLNPGGESASGASWFPGQMNSKGMELHGPLPVDVKLSTIHTHPNSDIQNPHHSDPTNKPLVLFQFLDPDCNTPMPEWRRTLHKLIALQGFRSSQAAGRYTAEHPVERPQPRQHAATFPQLQPGQAAAYQRVVQKIQMTDVTEVDLCCFNHIIPVASQHSFITSHLCGTTRFGRQQFDWRRGSEDGELIVLPVQSKSLN